MFSRLLNVFKPSGAPSVVLVVGKFGSMIEVLHILPDINATEHFGYTTFPS